jgi:hypothetical protein
MTAETLCPALVDTEFGGLGRMVEHRTVTVLTGDDPVGRPVLAVIVVGMAVLAVRIVELVLDLECFPVVLIALSVKAVHVPPLPDAEILGHDKEANGQNGQHETEKHKKRPEHVVVHLLPPQLRRFNGHYYKQRRLERQSRLCNQTGFTI